jgi:2-C-methyl-D-erythritol 4-phosphate cytidylyltransferase
VNVSAIIVAAGTGSRFGEKKQFRLLGKRPLLFYAIQPFTELDFITEIIVVVHTDDVSRMERELKSLISTKSLKVVQGGAHRQDSVYAGMQVVSSQADLICIHDGVRPFVTGELIKDAVNACENHDGVVVAIPSRDTLKQVMGDQAIGTLDRSSIWQAQTPQVFSPGPLKEAMDIAHKEKLQGTDEAALLERIGYQVGIVMGSPYNLKITTPEDWQLAEAIFNGRLHLKNDRPHE